MGKKLKQDIPKQAWLRLGLLSVLILGAVWLATARSPKSPSGVVVGEKLELPEGVNKGIQVLGETVDKIMPETKGTMVSTVEETQIVEEIKKTVASLTEQINGFPQKQEKEIKRQVIEDVCSQLLNDLEEE
ncbi:MAG: hypothetical protein ABIB61_01920 [Candidatus Shapirobacteria bacterium]